MAGKRPPRLTAEARKERAGVLWDEVTQTILHDPDQPGRYGNCLQAAVASMMRLPLDEVPHFANFVWWPQALRLWLRGRDLTMKGERTTEYPQRLALVGGKSERGVAHVVLGYEGRMVWDPHPSRSGLVSIQDATWFEPIENDYSCLWFDHQCGSGGGTDREDEA